MKKSISDLDDYALLDLYLKGNLEAFGVIVKRHSNYVFKVANLILRDNSLSEDLVQDTFIRAIMALRSGKYKESGEVKSWLARIAHNLCIDYARKQKRFPIDFSISETETFSQAINSSSFVVGEYLNPEEIMINAEEGGNYQLSKDELFLLISELSPEQKEVVVLRIFHDFSFLEIADYTDVSLNTALGRMRYALINLRKRIEEAERFTS